MKNLNESGIEGPTLISPTNTEIFSDFKFSKYSYSNNKKNTGPNIKGHSNGQFLPEANQSKAIENLISEYDKTAEDLGGSVDSYQKGFEEIIRDLDSYFGENQKTYK